jgi:hypothetical protein
MAKRILINCDRCGADLTIDNWLGDDELCSDCILLVTAAETVARQATIANKSQAAVLKSWLAKYEPTTES